MNNSMIYFSRSEGVGKRSGKPFYVVSVVWYSDFPTKNFPRCDNFFVKKEIFDLFDGVPSKTVCSGEVVYYNESNHLIAAEVTKVEGKK